LAHQHLDFDPASRIKGGGLEGALAAADDHHAPADEPGQVAVAAVGWCATPVLGAAGKRGPGSSGKTRSRRR